MQPRRSSALRTSAGTTLGTSDDRPWFLKNSRWEDSTWILAPTNALEERLPVRLHWDFSVEDGCSFTDARHAPLLQTSKRLIALIRGRSLYTGLPLRPSSVLNFFHTLRLLVRWMDLEGLRRFADLDRPALLQFQHRLSVSPTSRHSTRAASTVQRHLALFNYLCDELRPRIEPRARARTVAALQAGRDRWAPWRSRPTAVCPGTTRPKRSGMRTDSRSCLPVERRWARRRSASAHARARAAVIDAAATPSATPATRTDPHRTRPPSARRCRSRRPPSPSARGSAR